MKIKVGKDIKGLEWSFSRGADPFDWSLVQNLVVYALNPKRPDNHITPLTQTINGHVLELSFLSSDCPFGDYNIRADYQIPDITLPGGFINDSSDWVAAFGVVEHSYQEDLSGATYTTVLKWGINGLDADLAWLKANPDKTYPDYIAMLKQPAADAALALRQLSEQIILNETDRGEKEVIREGNEDQRKLNETARSENEDTREGNEDQRKLNETARGENEVTREGNEDQRKLNETARSENEDTREGNEDQRKLNETDRGEKEVIREENEVQRKLNEQDRIDNELLRKQTIENLNSLLENIPVMVAMTIIDSNTFLSTGDNQRTFLITEELNSMKLNSVVARVDSASTSVAPIFQVRNVTKGVDMLLTAVTINVNSLNSFDALMPVVVNPANAIINTGDLIAVDCDQCGNAKGAEIILKFKS